MSETRLTDAVETSEQKARRGTTFDPSLVGRASVDALVKLDPRTCTATRSCSSSRSAASSPPIYAIVAAASGGKEFGFFVSLAVWLWFTVLFANFAEAMAEGRGKAQADALRTMTTDTTANRLTPDGSVEVVAASELRRGDSRGRGRTRSSPETATSSRASPRWTSRRSPASPLPSSARAAATAARSRAARRCSPTASSCGSRPTPARRSSTG